MGATPQSPAEPSGTYSLANITGDPAKTIMGLAGAAILVAAAFNFIPMKDALVLFATLHGAHYALS